MNDTFYMSHDSVWEDNINLDSTCITDHDDLNFFILDN